MKKIAAEYIDINTLKPWDKNPRKNDHAVAEIVASIERFGFSSPIIARKSDNVIIAGHTRWKAAKQIGLKEVPVRFMDLDVVDSQLLAIADNKLNERATWDDNVLEQVLNELAEEDLTGLGFDDDELDNLLQSTTAESQDENEELPELEEEVHSQVGEVYELGPHRLMCADSTNQDNWNELLNGDKVNMIFTDPPYGMFLDANYSSMDNPMTGGGGKKYKQVIGDNEDFKPELITSIFDIFPKVKEIFLWGADYYAEYLQDKNRGSWIVWDKRVQENLDKMYGSSFELCWSKSRHKREIARITWACTFGMGGIDSHRHHPTQKPVKLVSWFFERWGKPGDIVADFYGGSGSTLLGCASNDRICRLMELDPQYCDVIRRRWTKYAKENGLEVGSGGLE